MSSFLISLITSGCISVILGFIGNILLERHKTGLNKEIESLRGHLEIRGHISRAQFDKEFNTYQEIWKFLFPAQISTLSLRPLLDSYDPSEPVEERRIKRLKSFYTSLSLLRDCIQINRPFIDQSIYKKIVEILQVSHSEAIEYEVLDPKDGQKEYFQKRTQNHQKIETLVDEACEMIRTRLSNVIVVD